MKHRGLGGARDSAHCTSANWRSKSWTGCAYDTPQIKILGSPAPSVVQWTPSTQSSLVTMDHGVWHQARDAAGRLYFFNNAGETRWDWPGGEAAPLAVQNAFAGALQLPAAAAGALQQPAAAAGGNAPISRELAERCLGEMRRDKAELARLEGELAAVADRDSQRDAQFAAAVADRAALATAVAESRATAADHALTCAAAAAAAAQRVTADGLSDTEAAWARTWPMPTPAPPPGSEADVLPTRLAGAGAMCPPPAASPVRPPRRARANVSYAEPNGNAKLRNSQGLVWSSR